MQYACKQIDSIRIWLYPGTAKLFHPDSLAQTSQVSKSILFTVAWHVTLFTPHTIIFISVCMIEKFLGLSIMSQICLKCPKTAVWSIDLVADWTCRRYWLAEITEMTEHIGTFFMFCCYSLVHYFWCMAMDKIKRHNVTRKGNAMKFTIMEREVGLSSCSSWLGFRIRSECLLKMRYVL